MSCTTAQFITWYQANYSFLSYYYTAAKCTWDYAGNNDISDTSIGAAEMAGSVIETFSDGTYYTIRISRPTTGAGGFVTLIYNNQGSGYSPGWRTDISSSNYNNFSPTLTGGGASGTWGINITGNSATVGGFTPSQSGGTANRVVVADANGYIPNSYFYTSGGGSERNTSGLSYVAGFNSSDYYIRSYGPAAVASMISGQTMNIGGTAAYATNLVNTGAFGIYSTTVGSAYSTAVCVREYNQAGNTGGTMDRAPRLGFHWGGIVASSIAIETNGRIGIWNNPGTAYEQFACGNLYVSGTVTATGDITAFSSDKRLKTDVRPITNAIDKVKLLNGIIYKWNDLANTLVGYDTTDDLVGLFAQEVKEVLPYAVKPAPFDYDADTKLSKSGEDYLTVQYEKLVPLLVEAIKDQQKIIEDQQKQIDQINATLALLVNK